jgi:hypothetical protein
MPGFPYGLFHFNQGNPSFIKSQLIFHIIKNPPFQLLLNQLQQLFAGDVASTDALLQSILN